MSDLDVLRELTGQLQRPAYDDLVAVAQKRRRRVTTTVAAGAAAAVVTVATAPAWFSGGERDAQPAENPTPSTYEQWTPEEVRAEGFPLDLLDHGSNIRGETGLQAQLYCIGEAIATGSPCDRYHPYVPQAEDQQWALEVTQGGRSALFDVQGQPLVKVFDEDSLLVQDGRDFVPRFRLLQADGTAVDLRLTSDLAPAVAGPDVILIQDLATYRSGMIGGEGTDEHPYLVDDDAGTLQTLDVPQEIEWWGPNVDEFLWGGDDCRVIWQRPDGSFDHHDVDCLNPDPDITDPGWNWRDGFAAWVQPGRMALMEWSEDGAPLAVHASLDYGTTWERVDIEQRDDWGSSTDEIAAVLEEAMQQLERSP